MNVDNYTIAWGLYLAGCSGAGLVLWRLIRRWPGEWQSLLLVSYTALVFTPFTVSHDSALLAPALFIVVLDSMFQGAADTASQAGLRLLAVWFAALLLSLLCQIMLRRYHAGRTGTES